MSIVFRTAGLLIPSNLFMTFAWYADYLWAAMCLMGAVYFMFRGIL